VVADLQLGHPQRNALFLNMSPHDIVHYLLVRLSLTHLHPPDTFMWTIGRSEVEGGRFGGAFRIGCGEVGKEALYGMGEVLAVEGQLLHDANCCNKNNRFSYRPFD
jgi:hypothetical protein